ncbi:MAG TPA: BON domain-containing protein [Flavitalea sp.]|nr:BON domain-containing protein [Flavitalea sp.]
MRLIYSFVLAFFLVSCGPSDEKVLTSVNAGLAAAGGQISAAVAKGVVTLNGECPDEACKTAAEAAVKSVKGVKSVVNNITVAPPPPPVINPDAALNTALSDIVGAYNTVKATVADGVVTLTGEIKRSQLTELMQKISAINPKKIENQLQIK